MATAAPPRVGRSLALYRLSVGKKIAMALSGVILVGFVILHFLGNLKVFQGPEAFNHYAEGLRTFGEPFFGRGQVLWIARIVLFIALVIHVVAAYQVYGRKRGARRTGYGKYTSLVFSQASRTMGWGGVAILAFVVYHIMHLTLGTVHPSFVPGDAYNNFVVGLRVWPVSLAYIAAMVPLGLHLYHGVWSATQTLGSTNERFDRWRRPIALGIALIVAGGNMILPLAVLLGIVG